MRVVNNRRVCAFIRGQDFGHGMPCPDSYTSQVAIELWFGWGGGGLRGDVCWLRYLLFKEVFSFSGWGEEEAW
jgi:hypothetical protein